MVLKAKIVITPSGGGNDPEGAWGVFLGAGNIIFLDKGSGFSDVFPW